jgi:hypothetical protein
LTCAGKTQKKNHQDASLTDVPQTVVPKGVEASQTFETTALAVAGAQKGAYYGSVQWGWRKGSSDNAPKLIDFQAASRGLSAARGDTSVSKEAAPSSTFWDAAALWNASKTSDDKWSIPLPIFADKFTNTKDAVLMSHPDTGKSLGKLDLNTRLGETEEQVTTKTDPKDNDWRKVIVLSGPLTGKVGFVKEQILSNKETEAKRKK